jgi:hypothetical protein
MAQREKEAGEDLDARYRWHDTIFELVASVAVGTVAPEIAANVFARMFRGDMASSELVRALVNSIWSHDVQVVDAIAHLHLASLVSALSLAGLVPLQFFKRHLDEELLERAGLIISASFSKRMKKLNTDQVYRQRKYNLLHEESEGYSKVMTLSLSESIYQTTGQY